MEGFLFIQTSILAFITTELALGGLGALVSLIGGYYFFKKRSPNKDLQAPTPTIKAQVNDNVEISILDPKSNKKILLRDLVFRCSSKVLAPNVKVACKNYLQHMTFAEVKNGFRMEENVKINLLREPIVLPSITQRNRIRVFKKLKQARCRKCGSAILAYSHLLGQENEYRIHLDMDFTENIIALTGPVGSGKTVFFHMLYQFFMSKYLGYYNIPVTLYPEVARDKIMIGSKIMRDEHKLPPPTAEGEEMELKFSIGNSKVQWPTSPINLFMCDTTGEIIQELQKMEKYFGSFIFSKSLVLFIDPFSIPGLARQCRSFEAGQNDVADPPLEILNRLIDFYKRNLNSNENEVPINLAITITKCDEFRHRFPEELIKAFDEIHPVGAQRPNLKPLDKISQIFKKWLLEQCNDENDELVQFINLADQVFQRVGYFSITALGTRSYKEKGEPIFSGPTSTTDFFMNEESSLEEQGREDDVKASPVNENDSGDRVGNFHYIQRIDGSPKPQFLDFPILWLHKNNN